MIAMSVRSEILVSCNDQVLKITEAPVLASGGLNEVRVIFSFCEKWKGFAKTALFYREPENIYYAVLDSNDTCVVPWEVCYEDGTFYFGVIGEKENTRRTSTVVRYKVKKGAITTDMLPSDPTPEVYDQIMAMLAEAKEEQENFIAEAGEVIDRAQQATTNANNATETANMATSDANTATNNANQAAESANTMAAFANESARLANTATASANEAIANASEATNEARAATEETNTARETFLQDAGEILSSLSGAVYAYPIECAVTGDVIAVKDASNQQLAGLNLYGKTTQNGTPTPTSPVPLESAGESGSIGVTVAGKNLLGRDNTNIKDGEVLNGITFSDNGDGSFTINGQCTEVFVKTIGEVILPAGTYVYSCHNGSISGMAYQLYSINADGTLNTSLATVSTDTQNVSFTIDQTTKVRSRFFANIGANPSNLVAKVQIEAGEVATEWEAHKPLQTLTASTPNGLHGIGDVCDEIDFARGVRVQRFHEVDMGTLTIQWVEAVKQFFAYLPTDKPMKGVPDNATAIKAFCTAYPVDAFAKRSNYDYVITAPTNLSTNVRINDKRYGEGQATEMKAALSGVKLIYELAQLIEIPLPAEELAAFAALHSHKPNTTAFNDGGAEMKLAYNADTKLYIDNKINELATAILNNA